MPAPRTRSNAELLDLISIWGEEAVQSQLRSSSRNYDTYRQISQCVTERGHDWDTLQFRVKVKALRNAYHKAEKANRHSGAVPTSCRFYKELDAILSCDPTSTVAQVPVESGLSQEEEILDENVEREGDPEAEDDLEARDACSQELFSTPEEGSQSQLSQSGEVQTGEEAPEMTLGAQAHSLLLVTERLRRIRKQPRRTKEDFLCDVMMQKQELKEWWDSDKRDQKEHAALQNEATERLLKVMEHQADMLQALLALQTKQLCTRLPLQPLSQNTFPCAPQRLPTHSYQPPGSSLYPWHSTPPPSQSSTADSQYPLHSTPIAVQFGPAEVQYPLHCTPKEAGYDPRTYTNL
ncbi:hypothetical protein UY3_05513 [Chelonia mydas]|uniref:Myb/SANT-like DNA-binding domain-containing protein n=1 Tax=Chelonia mydas TaxID=8469 RepID=M7BHA1_CHEMY|nr:hypothetical protein UY3_05513 [Chelonia mydas]